MDVVLTPCSHIPIPTKDKWKNRQYVKEYNRLKQRETNPPKQRLRVADDGRLMREHDPELAYKYPKRPKTMCVECGKEIFTAMFERHVQSKSHIQNKEIYERGLKTNPVKYEHKLPTPIFQNRRT